MGCRTVRHQSIHRRVFTVYSVAAVHHMEREETVGLRASFCPRSYTTSRGLSNTAPRAWLTTAARRIIHT